MLRMRNITKTFNSGTVDERVALDHMDLTLQDGDFVTVIGGNGAGKSTMQNAICGTWQPDEGSIELDGVNVSGMPEYKRAQLSGPRVSGPHDGHLRRYGDRGESGTGGAPRQAPHPASGHPPQRAGGLPPPSEGAGAGSGGPPHHQGGHPLRRPAAGSDAADGYPPAAQAAAVGRAHRRSGSPDRRPASWISPTGWCRRTT